MLIALGPRLVDRFDRTEMTTRDCVRIHDVCMSRLQETEVYRADLGSNKHVKIKFGKPFKEKQ